MSRIHLRSGVCLTAALLLAAVVAIGCEETDPARPLTVDEGAALLRNIRSDRSRAQNLTPAEKQYLLKTLKK